MSTTTGTTEENREGIQGAWDGIAAGYDEFVTPSHLWLGNEGLRRAGLRPGMRFLDVAAGSGALSLPAARRGAEVVATDLSPRMLERLEARARAEGLTLEARVMDGHALDLEDDAFDLAGSQFGVMLFPDMPRGIRELARVTRPGGRVLMIVYGAPSEIEFLRFFVRAVRSVAPDFPGLPEDPPPLPLQLQDPNRLGRELIAAGLEDVAVETLTESLEFRDGERLWGWLTNSNPITGEILRGLNLSEAKRAEIRRSLEAQVRERAGESDVAVLTNPIHVGIGRK